MKKQLLAYGFLFLILLSCGSNKKQNKELYTVTDASGRKVLIPEKIESIIALRSGALRLISYLNATDRVVAVEGNEKKREVPYLFAHPELRELPVIGTGNIAEPELLAAHNPDMILCTYLTAGEAQELQNKTAVPVIVVDYGDLNQRIDTFYKSLQFLGGILGKEKRADSLINYIKRNIEDLHERSLPRNMPVKTNVYIGGIAYRGSHGINSTEPQYAPFRFTNVKNVASELGEVTSSPKAWLENAFIDPEQLIEWNPDRIFLDVSGKVLWSEDLKNEALKNSLTAIRKNELYKVLPHNWYTINYENVLCNAWYVGKVLYPNTFDDIVMKEKANEIYKMFVGKPVYDQMMKKFNAWQRLELKE